MAECLSLKIKCPMPTFLNVTKRLFNRRMKVFEAEVKYAVSNEKWPEIKRNLEGLSVVQARHMLYEDNYYDSKDGTFYKSGKELRTRECTNLDSNHIGMILTFKDIPFDIKSGSKREFETEISSQE